ncbi:MAG: hypothetical protein IPG22_20740 [Acidobacteria bacterium]|nr:hypothetical protein [Acidobacteriota bacterium]
MRNRRESLATMIDLLKPNLNLLSSEIELGKPIDLKLVKALEAKIVRLTDQIDALAKQPSSDLPDPEA